MCKYLVIHDSSSKRPLGTDKEPCKMLGYDNDTRVDLVVVIEKYRQLKAEKHDIHNFVYHY